MAGPLPQFQYPLATTPSVIVTTADGDLDGQLPFAELELDPATWDVKVPFNILRGAPAIAQRLQVRLRFFKREWFLDQRQGMPYFEAILIKNPDVTLVQSLFRRAILSTPGVLSIVKLRTSLNAAERVFTITPLEILLTGGVIFRAQPDEFIIQVPRVGA
jgi:hypothetical protein